MQLEECKAAGGESELNRFVMLAASMGGASCTPRPIAPGRKDPNPWPWEGNWDLLGKQSGHWGISVAERSPGRGGCSPHFCFAPLGAWGAQGWDRAGFAPGWGRCICVGSTPAWGFKLLPGGVKHLRAVWPGGA